MPTKNDINGNFNVVSAEDLTPQILADTLAAFSTKQLNSLPHNILYAARERVSKEQQNVLAGPEHRAFAREVTADNPLMAIPLAAAIPLYQVYKTINGARSSASVDQLSQGFAGILDGLQQNFQSTSKVPQ